MTSSAPPGWHRWLPDAVFGLTWLLAAISLAGSSATGGHSLWLPWEILALGALLAAWVVRRRFRPNSLAATATLGASAVLVLASTDGSDAIPVFTTALVQIVFDRGWKAGSVMVLGVVAIEAPLMRFAYHQPWTSVAVQTFGIAVVLMIAVACATALRAFELQRRELAITHAQLLAAMDAQRDLVLAEERARAAAELHDGLGQQLTVVSMALDFARLTRAADPSRAWAEVDGARETVRDALLNMRLWVRALHPARLDRLEAPQGFDAIADVFRGTGLDVRVEQSGTEVLPHNHALFVYRMAQEGLTNALRHAGASRVDVHIDRGSAGLRVAVADNGSGADAVDSGFGLRGLRERAEALGGLLQVLGHGRLGGVELAASVPWAPQ